VLAQLQRVEGVEKAYANHSGRLFRVSVSPTADREKVAAGLLKALSDPTRKPVRLTGDEFRRALEQEEWRDVERVGELSAIEFRTLGLRRVATFAEEEKLDKESADKLVKMAEEEWDRLAQESTVEESKHAGKTDWSVRCSQFARAVSKRAVSVLTTEQVDRLKQALSAWPPMVPNGRGE